MLHKNDLQNAKANVEECYMTGIWNKWIVLVRQRTFLCTFTQTHITTKWHVISIRFSTVLLNIYRLKQTLLEVKEDKALFDEERFKAGVGQERKISIMIIFWNNARIRAK